MRVQFQRNFGTIGARGQWADLAPDEAALLIAHGIAHSDSGITDRAILDRAGRPDPDPPSAGKSLGDFVCAVLRNDRFYLEKHYGSTLRLPDGSTKAALAETSGAVGGYTVPIDFAGRIMALVAERSFLRPRALHVPLRSRELLFPLLDVSSAQAAGVSPFLGGIQLKWTPESQTRTESEPQLKQLALTAWELSGYAVVSVPLLQDGEGAALDAYLRTVFGEAVAWFEEFAFLQGTGIAQPAGIVGALESQPRMEQQSPDHSSLKHIYSSGHDVARLLRWGPPSSA